MLFRSGTLLFPNRGGGGVFCYQSGARIENNFIENNEIVFQQFARGGGICGVNLNPDPHDTYLIIENNKIRNNRCESNEGNIKGGGIYFRGEGRIVNNYITNNEAEYNGVPGNDHVSFGGGISCDWVVDGFASVKIYDNLIANNRALSNNGVAAGGGVFLRYTNCDFRKNTVKDNRVSGAPVAFGGGMSVLYSSPTSSIIDNYFINNGPLDPSVLVQGGGLRTEFSENLTVERNLFQFNKGNVGGGMNLLFDVEISVRNNKFLQNDAIDGGGGIFIDECSPLIENNLVAGNTSWFGGGVCMVDVATSSKKSDDDTGINTLLMMAGGLGEITAEKNVSTTLPSQLKKTTTLVIEPLLINNTIVDNSATAQGGGIYSENSQPIVLNTILWGNTAAQDSQIYVLNDTVLVEYSDVQGSWLGEGNIDVDPFFVGSDSLYHLSDSSLCINTGIDSLLMGGLMRYCPPDDYEGDQRPHPGTMPDIGADETDIISGIEPVSTTTIPNDYNLYQNYPNPFNPSTTIEFALPAPGFVTLSIFNILGEKVATLVSEELTAGSYKYHWDATELTSGVYFYRIQTGLFVEIKKMLLLK